MPELPALDAAIAALNAQRPALGDVAVNAAIEALRRHAPAEAVATGRRLRQVSVLFVDVADSTHLLSQAGAEEAEELLDLALQHFAAVVQRCGGAVLRFTGDGLKAVFGSQVLREDEAVHAVHAGLQILQAAGDHARQLRLADFGVRVGIHTGAVLLGGGAEAERGAIGHAVHLAARMEQSAPVGRLRISHDTFGQVRGLFRVQPQPPLWVKGHDEPLLTYLVLGAESDPERAVQRGIEGLATPMIGRDAELQRLLAAHDQACSRRSLRAVTVLADAGVGKTRLRRELLSRLSLGTDGAGLLQARAHPDSGLQPYGLLRQLVARWFSITDDLDAASARTRLVNGLAPWLGARGPERAQVVGQLIGLDFSASDAVQMLGPRELREQAFAALTDALHALAGAAPLLVMLDDLHWADDASLDFVQHLARAAPVPLLLVMLARPALLERRPAPLAGEGVAHETLRLQPLDAEQGPALAATLLQHLPEPPEALWRLLVERAEGNPFYMEELVRMLIDDGVIELLAKPTRRRERLSLMLQRSRTEAQMGDLDQARRTCDEAAAWAASLDIARLGADVANALAEVAQMQGDISTVESAACEAQGLARGAAHAVGLASAWNHRAAAAAARGETAAARALWADAQRQFEEQGVPDHALDIRAELAELDRREGRIEAAAAAALALLADGRGDAAASGADPATEPWPLLGPGALLHCHAILAQTGHAQAVPIRCELQRRLQQQLAQSPDALARQRLLQAVPHWRETARLCADPRGPEAT